jgi:hypothetical protein
MRNSKCSDLRKVAMLLSLSHTQAQQKHYFPTIKTLETQINKNTPSHSQLNKLKKNCLILSVFRISSPVPYYTTEEGYREYGIILLANYGKRDQGC